ncbi:MAG: acyl-CoA synthase [Cellvibrionales bacterium]|nr:acyl-CoA synthase [Cellvibrionales bacterium]
MSKPFNPLQDNHGKGVFEVAKSNAHVGMEIAAVAALTPDRVAITFGSEKISFRQLNQLANQIAHRLLRAGITAGDAVALLCSNRIEFVAVRFACHRIGVRLTPVNWHLAPEEAAYIIDNCDAKVLFADARVKQAAIIAAQHSQQLIVKVSIGGEIDNFDQWNTLKKEDAENISQPVLGNTMLYTSGTTGKPKGVYREQPDPSKAADMQAILTAVFQFDTESGLDQALTPGPMYHSGPFNLCMTTPLTSGIGIVLMDKWDPEDTLKLIEQHKISHAFFVPTMFVRMLKLDQAIKDQYSISSLKFVIHGAAPCAMETKQAMLDWFGPIIWEMFAGTEGPGTIVSPQDWLAKPGTVGKPGPDQIRILDGDGQPVEGSTPGQLFLINPPNSQFNYYKDPTKTESTVKNGYFTAGDIGYLDKDGFLFLTGRSAEVIISGGVNIYPQEIDNILIKHDEVADAACIGVPNDEWGEEVKAVVQLKSGRIASAELTQQLIEFTAKHLAKQKTPRSIDFIDELPRNQAGKVQRKKLRDSYWPTQQTII